MMTVLIIEGIIWGAILGAIIYLIVRRVKIKKQENFEDRDN